MSLPLELHSKSETLMTRDRCGLSVRMTEWLGCYSSIVAFIAQQRCGFDVVIQVWL